MDLDREVVFMWEECGHQVGPRPIYAWRLNPEVPMLRIIVHCPSFCSVCLVATADLPPYVNVDAAYPPPARTDAQRRVARETWQMLSTMGIVNDPFRTHPTIDRDWDALALRLEDLEEDFIYGIRNAQRNRVSPTEQEELNLIHRIRLELTNLFIRSFQDGSFALVAAAPNQGNRPVEEIGLAYPALQPLMCTLKMSALQENETECNICYEEMGEPGRHPRKVNGCGHIFCEQCFRALLNRRDNRCPYCRAVFNRDLYY